MHGTTARAYRSFSEGKYIIGIEYVCCLKIYKNGFIQVYHCNIILPLNSGEHTHCR